MRKGVDANSSSSKRGRRSNAKQAVDERVAAARDVFGRLPDDAFFVGGPSAPVQHLYMYGEVTPELLTKLRGDLDDAVRGDGDGNGGGSGSVAARPIVLHINSPGGAASVGLSMMSIFNECHVPICACVDGMSASAATFVSILAPYRVMLSDATSLVHDYASFTLGKRDDLMFDIAVVGESLTRTIRAMYARRTRIDARTLDELMSRDRLLPAADCLRLGMCERVIEPPYGLQKQALHPAALYRRAAAGSGAPMPMPMPMPLSLVMRKTNLNHVRFDCQASSDYALGGAQRLDQLLRAGAGLRPVVIHADGGACLSNMFEHVVPLAHRIALLSAVTPTYGVIDTEIQLVDALPLLACSRRVMYSHASVVVHLVYKTEFGWMLRDTMANTDLMLARMRAMLRSRARPDGALLEGLDRRRFLLSAQECLKQGLVHDVIEA